MPRTTTDKPRGRSVQPHDFYSPPKPTRCPTCRADIWEALHDAHTIRVTPEPLNQIGELSTLITGRKTYLRIADRLIRRTARHITDRPTPILGTIHTTHHCGQPPDPSHLIRNDDADQLGGLFEPPCPF